MTKETTTPIEAEAEQAATNAEKATTKRKRVNRNPESKPTPTAGQFLYHYNLATSRQDAVDRMVAAGYHMTYGSLSQRVRDYEKNPAVKKLLKDMPRPPRRPRLASDEIAADFNAEKVRVEGEPVTETEVEGADTVKGADSAPIVSENAV